MKLTRRASIILGVTGGILSGSLAHASLATGKRTLVPVQTDGLDILLENLREEIAKRSDARWRIGKNYNEFLVPATTAVWNALLVRHLIPTEVDRGYHDTHDLLMVRVRGEHLLARNRRLSPRWTFEGECAYENEIMAALAQAIAAEHDQDLLSTMYSAATRYPAPLPSAKQPFRAAIAQIARRMNPPGRWIVIAPCVGDQFDIDINDRQPGTPAAYLDDLPVFVNLYARDAVLIGHDGSQESALLWSPHLLMNPNGIVIDPHTFEPRLPFSKRHGVWFDAARASRHFVIAETNHLNWVSDAPV